MRGTGAEPRWVHAEERFLLEAFPIDLEGGQGEDRDLTRTTERDFVLWGR